MTKVSYDFPDEVKQELDRIKKEYGLTNVWLVLEGLKEQFKKYPKK